MKIVVIDTGLSEDYFSKRNRIHIMNADRGYDSDGHGTMVTNILDDRVTDQDIYICKVASDCRNITVEDLAQSIYDASVIKPDIINISMGTLYDENDKVKTAIHHVARNGNTLVVAAAENGGAISFPAYYKETISIIWDSNIKRLNEFKRNDGNGVDFLGFGGLFTATGLDGVNSVSGSSFLVPIFVALVINSGTFKRCNNKLAITVKRVFPDTKECFYDGTLLPQNNVILEGCRTLVFPLNKEINTLINNADILKLDIVQVCDAPFSGKIGLPIKSIFYRSQKIDGNISNIFDVDWHSDSFDTVVVGHLGDISNLYRYNFQKMLSEKAKKYHKNMYYLDNIQPKPFYTIKSADVASGSLYGIHAPVVAVVGVGSKMGKADLAMSMHRTLRKIGYKSALFMTEPYFGLVKDASGWANGYGTQSIGWMDEVKSVNRILHQVDESNPDIIIVETQSQVMPFAFENLGFMPRETENVLSAVNPDAFILVSRKDTNRQLLIRTKQYLESYYNAPVIGKFHIARNEGENSKQRVLDHLTNKIIEFFSEN
mgnify:CR=1 FL=1